MECSVAGCGRKAYGRGWCKMHWRRWRRHGNPETVLRIVGDLPKRFWSKVQRGNKGDCWLWLASMNASGYGTVGVGRTSKLAHRVAYELEKGPIPDGAEIDHLCRVRSCVNPAHLEAVDRPENMRRAGLLGAAAVNAAKTHCPRGHPLAGDNVRMYRGRRHCRACDRERLRRRRQ